MDQAEGLRTLMRNGTREKAVPGRWRRLPVRPRGALPKVLSVASGKGGVGKTNLVANLGFAFTQLGKRILILDADLGLANIDVLLGLAPRYTIEHLFNRTKTFSGTSSSRGPAGCRLCPPVQGFWTWWT